MSVSDAEVAAEYRRRNEKVKLDVVPVTPEAFKSQVTVTDAEVAAHFEKSKDTYRIGEKRKIKYALRRRRSGAPARSPCPRPTSRRSTSRTSRSTRRPAQVRASHILFKTRRQGRKGRCRRRPKTC